MLKRLIIACIAFIYTVNCSENSTLLEASASASTAPLEAVNYAKISQEIIVDNPQTTEATNDLASLPNLPGELLQPIMLHVIKSEAAQNKKLLHFLHQLYTLRLVSSTFWSNLRIVCSDAVLTDIFEHYLPAAFIPHKDCALTVFRNIGKKIVRKNGTVNKAEKEFTLLVNSIHENWEGEELGDMPFKLVFQEKTASLFFSALCCTCAPLAQLAFAYSRPSRLVDTIIKDGIVDSIAQLPPARRNQAFAILLELFRLIPKNMKDYLINSFNKANIFRALYDTMYTELDVFGIHTGLDVFSQLKIRQHSPSLTILQEVIRNFPEDVKQDLKNRFYTLGISLDVQSTPNMGDDTTHSGTQQANGDHNQALLLIEEILKRLHKQEQQYQSLKDSVAQLEHMQSLLQKLICNYSENLAQDLKNRFYTLLEISLDVQSTPNMSDDTTHSKTQQTSIDPIRALDMIKNILRAIRNQAQQYHTQDRLMFQSLPEALEIEISPEVQKEIRMSNETISAIGCKSNLMAIDPINKLRAGGIDNKLLSIVDKLFWHIVCAGDSNTVATFLEKIGPSDLSDASIGIAIYFAIVQKHKHCLEILLQRNPPSWALRMPALVALYYQDDEAFNMLVQRLHKVDCYTLLMIYMMDENLTDEFVSELCTKIKAPADFSSLILTCARENNQKKIGDMLAHFDLMHPKYKLLINMLLIKRGLDTLCTLRLPENMIIKEFLQYLAPK